MDTIRAALSPEKLEQLKRAEVERIGRERRGYRRSALVIMPGAGEPRPNRKERRREMALARAGA